MKDFFTNATTGAVLSAIIIVIAFYGSKVVTWIGEDAFLETGIIASLVVGVLFAGGLKLYVHNLVARTLKKTIPNVGEMRKVKNPNS